MAGQRFVALLRGINVGGHNVIKMADLRASFAGMGFTDVETLIASGNVVFTAKRASKSKLIADIEQRLSRDFRYRSRVHVVSADELTQVVAEAPTGFGGRPVTYRYDVLFVMEPFTAKQALAQVPVTPRVDEATAGRHALYFRRLVAKAAQSHLVRLAQQPVYQHLTVRNWNTTTKLLALASQAR